MASSPTVLGSITPAIFLRDYWQKQPLLIRQGLPGFQNPLAADEIAGLACEDCIESRLILGPEVRGNWELEHGPLAQERFDDLPPSNWTLHLQGIEVYLREAYQLFDYFRFIPNWRIDDIMVSYAPDQGSAGPHFDFYDVFLVQAEGRKRWRLGQPCDSDSALVPDIDLRILEHMDVTQEFVVEPGDVLYIPPRIAHHGVADGDSITYSVGFRAPGIVELADEFAQHLATTIREDQRYQDPNPALQAHPGSISPDVRARIAEMLKIELDRPGAIEQWFGSYMTRPKVDIEAEPPEQVLDATQLRGKLETAANLYWCEGTRVAYADYPDGLVVFINGAAWPLAKQALELAQLLSAATRIDTAALLPLPGDDALNLLCECYNEGLISFD